MADQVDLLNYIIYQNRALLAAWTNGEMPDELPDLLIRPRSEKVEKKFASPDEVRAFLSARR